MHTIKPSKLGLLARPVEHQRRAGLSISAYLFSEAKKSKESFIHNEQSLWNFLAEEMNGGVIDEGTVKIAPEFLVHGYAYTRGAADNEVAVHVRLGDREKTILAFGDRYWEKKARCSSAKAFRTLPLTWSNAYGGKGFPANTAGRGRAETEGVRWLPNLELPESRMLQFDKEITPAGFGPLAMTHPQRAKRAGTYDADWLKQQFPGFPSDLDWTHFNMAPRDQWFNRPLVGDESYCLENMHPTKALVEGDLPGLCARVFANYEDDSAKPGEQKLREIPMSLTTVWFFPHCERIVLIFQGLARTKQDDGSDIKQLLGAVDRIGALRPQVHFAEVLRKRTSDRRADVHSLNDADLLPEGFDVTNVAVQEKLDPVKPGTVRADAQYRKAQIDFAMGCDRIRARGKDPLAMGLKMPEREQSPSIAELPAFLDRVEKEAEKRQWASIEKMVTAAEGLQRLIKEKKVNPAQLVTRGPPKYKASEHLAELAQKFAEQGISFNREEVAPKLAQQEVIGRLNYLKAAHTQAPALPLRGRKATAARDEVEWLLARRIRTLQGWDLTGADLSNLDLRRVNFTGAWLESANLSNANLSHANLTAAVLAYADLRGLVAIKTRFEGANLGRSLMEGAVFDDSNFAGAVLDYCKFEGSQFPNAKLTGALMLESEFGASDWEEASAHSLIFNKRDLKGMVFTRAQMTSCTFVECDLSGVDFRGANLTGGTFVGCRAEGVKFAGANLERAMFVQKTRMVRADFAAANLKGSNLAECDLSEAKLAGANLDGANLTMTIMPDVDARRLSAKGAMLRKANLLRADCRGADFKEAILQYADLRGARMNEVNFYGSDLARVRLSKDTDLDKAHMKRARVYPQLATDQRVMLP